MNKDFHHFLRTRRSIREFEPRPIPDSILRHILETTLYAPSAHNNQPWRFAILDSLPMKIRLADALGGKFKEDLQRDGMPPQEITARLERSRQRILNTPAVIILCMDTSDLMHIPDGRRRQAEMAMAVQSTALAGLQLMLAAHAEGIGSVWTCGPLFAQETTRSVLQLPDEWQPQAMICLGYPARLPDLPARKALDELTKFIS